MIKKGDIAHDMLMPFIKETEDLLGCALKSIDPNATCRIIPAADLGFPHDVIRIAGGFPTGCLVEWNCETPFVPIDTTVNIDTSSIFVLDRDISGYINEGLFDWLRNKFEISSYEFNFHKGNHFISFGRMLIADLPVLIIHSNEKEFKYQYNGLMPSDENWFSEKVRVLRRGSRYVRYIVGDAAAMFVDLAHSLEQFNIMRHRFVAHLITRNYARIVKQEDHHHYYMPTRQSVAIGCFPIKTNTRVPVFSRPGRNIAIFEPASGGKNIIGQSAPGEDVVLVPHGWGKTCVPGTTFSIDYDRKIFDLSGCEYEIKAQVTLGRDEKLHLRDFTSNDNEHEGFFDQIVDHCPGKVVDQIVQFASFTKNGFEVHRRP
ncbi:MAG: hypothetical protein E6Q50_09260 [Lysobacter sp.]|nr:MAG: hypothetical protein E6Q50_09260 [Lysobacter sp.]